MMEDAETGRRGEPSVRKFQVGRGPVDNLHVGAREPPGERLGQRGVDLHGGQPRRALAEQIAGQAGPGPHLQDVITEVGH